MATQRKKYFRVGDSVFNEAWTNDELATLVRLMAYLNTRWARSGLEPDEACAADIPIAIVMQITGRRRADVARKLLRRLTDLTGMTVEHSSDVSSIRWPKFAVYQEYQARAGPVDAPQTPPPQPQPQPQPQKRKSLAGKPAQSPCRQCGSSHGRNGRAFPEKLSESEAAALNTWAESKQIPIATVHAAAHSIRNWYDALPSRRARACWVAVIRKAATEEDNKRRRSNGTGSRGAPRPPGPDNAEMPQQRGYREGSDTLKTNNPASGSDFIRELESKLKAVGK